METKQCTACSKVKPATREFFYYQKMGKLGLQARCILCTSANSSQAGKRDREKLTAYNRAYRTERREVVRDWKRTHYLRHQEEVKEAVRRYRRETPDYWKISPDAQRVKDARRRARKVTAGGSFTKADVRAIFQEQSGLCFWCACDLEEGFHADHYIPLARGGSNGAENIVASCPNCNLRKGDLLPEEFAALKERT